MIRDVVIIHITKLTRQSIKNSREKDFVLMIPGIILHFCTQVSRYLVYVCVYVPDLHSGLENLKKVYIIQIILRNELFSCNLFIYFFEYSKE